ncbi:hypothetical protein [Micromonospora craniellae]|uniref:Uncharacterized protein n=1 Tax=Micromonospora craniellae TaxID=2294034 RepID=A0A372FQQ1_9ACTN|nr:hypothetical protein [Micromonospora craniellae]QOC93853.1 hypothetical protein ID554_09610 [Micromonospora craniellae]RFS37673.1 hypothetical protein D0Q02_31265 [Micromonospora craniellae]
MSLVLTPLTTPADVRRLVNARLHAEHLGNDTLSMHAVAVAKAGRAVLLVGDHGAGKSLTGLKMITSMGWHPIAGDTTLVRLGTTGRIDVVGGTRAFVMRRSAVAHWFPALALPIGGGERIDLAESMPIHVEGAPLLCGIVMVTVDRSNCDSPPLRCGQQVTVNALYRASGYLITKVLDDVAAEPLSLVEAPELARHRLRLVRRLASAVRCWWLRGTPGEMAEAIDGMTVEGNQRWAN